MWWKGFFGPHDSLPSGLDRVHQATTSPGGAAVSDVWLLGAQRRLEGDLAEAGYFQEAAAFCSGAEEWVDGAAAIFWYFFAAGLLKIVLFLLLLLLLLYTI